MRSIRRQRKYLKNNDNKIFKADIEIICGEYSFIHTELFVCKNLKEAEKLAGQHILKENAMYPGETFYRLLSLEELNFLDGYKIKYFLEPGCFLT